MKTALIMTTINVPVVLALYRKLDPDVRFFVAGDEKTPSEVLHFCGELMHCSVVGGTHYACDALIGWNTIARRNIALLEALKWGADIIVSIDDDNIPLDNEYFAWFEQRLVWGYEWNGFTGIKATSPTNWFDVGTLLDPVAPHRGFPHVKRAEPVFASVVGARVGAAAGICLGDPDISATTRIAQGPIVHRVSELLRAGIVVDPATTHTVFNSQNTAFIRELAPCFLMVPNYGRYDDIYAGLVAQRVAREHGYHIHFGQPFVWQTRNQHNLLKDLAQEQWGSEHILEFTAWLDGFILKDVTPVAAMRILFTNLPDWMPDRGKLEELGLAWASDCEQVMK